jgi:hypothetical protein
VAPSSFWIASHVSRRNGHTVDDRDLYAYPVYAEPQGSIPITRRHLELTVLGTKSR